MSPVLGQTSSNEKARSAKHPLQQQRNRCKLRLTLARFVRYAPTVACYSADGDDDNVLTTDIRRVRFVADRNSDLLYSLVLLTPAAWLRRQADLANELR